MTKDLIDPAKIRGKYIPKEPNTDIDADPITSPPEQSYKKDLPKEPAEFIKKKKDPISIDQVSLWAAIVFTLGAFIISAAIPIKGFSIPVKLGLATTALVFNMKNTHQLQKTYPVLGFNPLNIITIVDIILILWALYDFLIFALSLGQA